jgi:hypothetical protein
VSPLIGWRRRLGFNDTKEPNVTTLDRYEKHVSEYTQANLTFDCDILNAFAGIQAEYEAMSGFEFCWGLPLHGFDRALLWKFNHDAQRDSLKRRSMKSGSQGCPFPSWSWAGWIGPIRYDSSSVTFQSFPISWPWQAAREGEDKVRHAIKVFQTGILEFRTQSVMISPKHIARLHMTQHSGHDWTEGHRKGILLSSYVDLDGFGYMHVLIVKKEEDDIYYREGLCEVQDDIWSQVLKPSEEQIRLG